MSILLDSGVDSVTSIFKGWGENIGGAIYWIAIIVLAIALGIGLILWALNVVSWKYNVILLVEGSDKSTYIQHDLGKIVKRRDGSYAFKLKKDKKAVPPIPPAEAEHYSAKGRKTVFIKKFGSDCFDYYPLGINLRGTQVDIKQFPQGRRNWMQSEFRINRELFGEFWDKYGNAILWAGTMLLFIVAIVIIFKMNQDIVNTWLEIEKMRGTSTVVASSPPGA